MYEMKPKRRASTSALSNPPNRHIYRRATIGAVMPRTRDVPPPLISLAELRGAAELSWYGRQLVRMADGHDPDESLSMGWSLVVRLARDWLVARRLRRHLRTR
jgi:hypothetical protein